MHSRPFINLPIFISRSFYSFSMHKGKFIVLEGLDRSGKSSITKFIQAELS